MTEHAEKQSIMNLETTTQGISVYNSLLEEPEAQELYYLARDEDLSLSEFCGCTLD